MFFILLSFLMFFFLMWVTLFYYLFFPLVFILLTKYKLTAISLEVYFNIRGLFSP